MIGGLGVLFTSKVHAHNLDTRATSISFAKDFVQTMSSRAAGNFPLVQVGDEFWVVIKTTPGPGTNTGVGGYQTFYIPTGAQVVDAAYAQPSTSDPRGFIAIPMKGQSPIAIGDGPIGAKVAVGLTGYSYPLANVLGVNSAPVTAGGISRGTLAGVYADTGIFYSTDARTAFNSYGAAISGGNPAMRNNSGDTVGEWDAAVIPGSDVLGVMTLWDSFQLRAFGRADVAPIIDPADGRGNAPWGMASAVAGPQSGYRWSFNFNTFTSTVGTTAQKVQAGIETGPWNRIRYAGSQISNDQPGLISTALGYAGVDGSSVGYDFGSGPLPTNTNAIRFAIGQLELGRSEYSAVKIKINTLPNVSCYKLYADAFGGDAGGTDNGKDHIWRYFDPTVVSVEPCTLLQKVATNPLITLNGTTSYNITFANNGSVALPNVVLTDTLPSGLTYTGATPAPTTSSGSVQTWNLGTVPAGGLRTITLFVRGTATGVHLNTVTATSNGTNIGTAYETIEVASRSVLSKTKTVTPSSVAPGGTVTYTITVANDGTAGNGVPLVITDHLPPGFTYQSFTSATINGGAFTPAINSSNTAKPVFTISPQSILPGRTLVIRFSALVSSSAQSGTYYNSTEMQYEGKRIPPIPEAPVTVGGARIGDFVWRDWDGDGVQDAGEEGISGVGVQLWSDPNGDGNTSDGSLITSTTTGANGEYLFTGLAAGNYVVRIPTPPAGSTQTFDPQGAIDNQGKVTLAATDTFLAMDFGYRPTGSGQIGDQVFEDLNKNGVWNGGEPNIPNVTVNLYEDSNGSGSIDAGDAFVATQATGVGGTYNFTGLNTSFSYLAQVDTSDGDIATYFNALYGNPVNTLISANPQAVASGFTTVTTADFGFWRAAPASIGDQVFVDNNGNTIYDGGDVPMANVTVRLFASDGVTLLFTTSTDVYGKYLFGGLAVGTYVVRVDVADPDIASNLSASISQYTGVGLIAGQNDLSRDFPFVVVPSPLSKAVNLATVSSGQNLTYTLTPNYVGNALLTNVVVNDATPVGTTFVNPSASPTPASQPANGATGTVSWNLGSTAAASNGSTTVSGNTVTTSTITHVAFAGNAGSETTRTVPKPATTVANDVLIAGLSWDGGDDRTINSVPSGWTQIGSATSQSGGTTPATIALRGTAPFTVTTAADPNNLTLPKPSGLAVGDLMIANISQRGTSATDASATGWLLIRGAAIETGGQGMRGTLLYKVAVQADVDASDFTFTIPGTGSAGCIIAFSGVDTTGGLKPDGTSGGPFDVQPAASMTVGGSGNVSVPEITTATANAAVILLAMAKNPANPNWSAWQTATGPLTLSEVYDGGHFSDTRSGVGAAWALKGTAGLTGVGTATKSGNEWGAMLLALRPASITTKHGLATYYKVAGGSEPADYAWGISAAGNWTVGISTYRGVDNTTPIDVHAVQGNASSTSATAPTITTTVNNARLVAIYASKNGTPVAAPPGTMTERIDFSTAVGTTTQAGLEMADETFATAGATGTRVATLSAATINLGRLMALRPAVTTTPWSYSVETALSSNRSMVKTGDAMSVTMAVTATTITGTPPFPITVTPGSLSVTGTNSATAAFAAASPTSVSLASGVGQSFTYNSSSITAGSNHGVLTLRATPTGPSGLLAQGTANTVLAVVPMVYQAKVDIVAPPGVVNNIAQVTSGVGGNGGIPSNNSNEVSTLVDGSIGDFVWEDTNSDGDHDVGEPALAGIRLYIDSNSDGDYDIGEPTQITNFAGAYRFSGLAPGTYSVRYDYSTVPAGFNPTTPLVVTHTLAANEQYNLADFGLAPPSPTPGSIGDTLWIDANEDGIVDAGEARLPNVDVQLYLDSNNDGAINAGELLISTVSTNASGQYSFPGVNPGNYLVRVETSDPQFPAALEPVSGGYNVNGLQDVTLGANQNYTAADFGYNYTGSIGDTVFYDPDQSRTQNNGELGVEGVTIVLYNDVDNSGTLSNGDIAVRTAFTNGSGQYLFDNLPPGNYVVKADEQTVQSTPTSGIYGTMLATTGSSKAVVLSPGDMTDLDADFGFIEAAEIAGRVFHDINSNGVYDPGETPLQPVTVRVYGPGVDGILGNADDLADLRVTLETNPAGEYSTLVPPGGYRVIYDLSDPQAQVATLPRVTTVLEYQVYVTSGQELGGLDFGRDNNGSIGDTIFADTDGTSGAGVGPGAGDARLRDVVVNLFYDTNGDGIIDTDGIDNILGNADDEPLLDSRVTDANGNYLFVGLADTTGPAKYLVAVNTATLPSNYQTTASSYPTGAVPATSVFSTTLTGGAAILNADFGYPPQPSTFLVSGNIWNDNGAGGGIGGDGTKNGGELNLANIGVTISVDSDGAGPNPPVLFNVTTDGSGNYSLAGVPGTAVVVITVATATLPSAGFGNTGDPDGVRNSTTTFTMAGANVINQDFGYREVLASVAGTVVRLADGNGLADPGETAVPGVAISLRYTGPDGIPGTGDDVITPTTTDSNGDYSFSGLLPGFYQITKTNPSGLHNQADRDGGNPTVIELTIAPGNPVSGVADNKVDQDFEITKASFGDYVWYDLNGNGVPDGGEPVLAGVRVYVDANGNSSYDPGEPTAITNGSGLYTIDDIAPGTYAVRVDPATLPVAGLTPSFDLDGIGTANAASVTLVANQSRTDVDWGYMGSATVTGHLYIDTNGDGVQNNGEPNLANVDVVITDVNGLVRTVSTDAFGDWVVQVPPGSTTSNVSESDPQFPAGVVQTQGTDETTVTAVGGQSTNGGIDGYFPSGTVAGKVWVDNNADGIGNVGLGGVTIRLFVDADANGVPDDSGTPFRTTTTSTGPGTLGEYSFTGVPVGSYVIVQTQPAGFRSVTDGDTTGGGDDATNTLTNDDLIPVALIAGETDSGNDFVEEAICPPTWAEWQIRNPLGGSNGPTQNPDGDRWSNLHEFVYCFNPSSGVAECPLSLVFNLNGTIDATVRQVQGAVGVTYRLEYIADLRNSGINGAGWTDSGITPVLTNNPDGSVKATYANLESLPGLNLGYGFVRSVVTADINSNTVIEAGETVRSNVEGWMDQSFRVNCESCSLPFESCPVVSGVAGVVTGNAFSASAALGGSNFISLLTPGKGYYMEVLSGVDEGHRFHLNTAATISGFATSVVLDPSSLRNTKAIPADFGGASYAIRPYKTIGEQFPVADFTAGLDASTSDYVLVYDVATASWVTIYLMDVSGTKTWVRAGQGLTSQAGFEIDPSAALFVHRRVPGTPGPTLTRTLGGAVRSTKFAMPLPAACRMGSNPWPVAASPAGRGLLNTSTASAVPFVGASSSGAADQVMLWGGDVTLNALNQEVYYYLDTATRDHYTRAGNSNLPDLSGALLFLPLRSQYYCMKTAHLDYVMPLPWTP